jgi:hypothetical protein
LWILHESNEIGEDYGIRIGKILTGLQIEEEDAINTWQCWKAV